MTFEVTDREWAILLAALRSWQQALSAGKKAPPFSSEPFDTTLTPLTAAEVGDLCARLTCDPPAWEATRQLISLRTPIEVWPPQADLPVAAIALVGERLPTGDFSEVTVHGLVPAGGGLLMLRRPVAVVITKALVAAVQDVDLSSPPANEEFLG